MEPPQQLLSDSFSYRWLTSVKSSASLGDSRRSVDTQDGAFSFIEIDPGFISMRWTNDDNDANDFNFDLPRSQCSVQVNADKIFSSGRLLPLHVRSPPGTDEAARHALDVVPSSATSATSSLLFHTLKSSPYWMSSSCSPHSRAPRRSRKFNMHFVRNCAKSPKKILRKYFYFLMPLYRMVKDYRLSSATSTNSCKDSARSSPRTSSALSSIEWCRSNADISIYDAILHCKKSIGQDK